MDSRHKTADFGFHLLIIYLKSENKPCKKFTFCFFKYSYFVESANEFSVVPDDSELASGGRFTFAQRETGS